MPSTPIQFNLLITHSEDAEIGNGDELHFGFTALEECRKLFTVDVRLTVRAGSIEIEGHLYDHDRHGMDYKKSLDVLILALRPYASYLDLVYSDESLSSPLHLHWCTSQTS